MNERREYRIIQNGQQVAACSGPSEQAQVQAAHYLVQYVEEGPCELQEKISGEWVHIAAGSTVIPIS